MESQITYYTHDRERPNDKDAAQENDVGDRLHDGRGEFRIDSLQCRKAPNGQ